MVGNAYSLISVKAVDATKRIITGMASTPTPDRGGDIVEPTGVKFQNPMPLLLYHDTQRPVGTVKFLKPTKDGIPFEAQIADISEPGVLKERVDEAWQSVKSGLLKGVSIGYRILSGGAEFMRETGGLHLKSIEVFELSLVSVPMNAEATIAAIKSIDAEFLAATGRSNSDSQHTPAVAGSQRTVKTVARTTMAKKTYAEQIADIKAQIQTKHSDIDALQTKVTEEGRTKDATEREQFDAMNAEIENLEKELVDLEKLEARSKSVAQPAAATAAAAHAAAQQATKSGYSHVSVKANRAPGIGFARLVMCKMAAFMSHYEQSPVEIAKARYPHDEELQHAIKANVAGGLTTDATWAQPLAYPSLANEFVEYLRPQTIIGKFGTTVNGVTYPGLQPVPFNVKINRETAVPTGYWVGEGKPVPVSKEAFDAVTMAYTKVGALSVISKELARFSSPSAEALVRNALVKSTVARLDTDFIDPAKAASAGVNPASLTYGVTTVGASAGTSADNARTDIIKLLAAFQIANFDPSTIVLIMPNTLCMALSILTTSLGTKQFPTMSINGGYLEGIPVIGSQYAASADTYGNMVVAVDTSSIGLADDGDVTVDVSMEAALQMLDNPTNDLQPTATSMVSLWQTNSIGIKTERYINWAKLRSGAVQWYDDINWGSVGSPA